MDPDAYLMAVAVGAACDFLTPIGHQCNTLVMGPGGYRFSDYWKLGLPLSIIVIAIATPLIVTVWPLNVYCNVPPTPYTVAAVGAVTHRPCPRELRARRARSCA